MPKVEKAIGLNFREMMQKQPIVEGDSSELEPEKSFEKPVLSELDESEQEEDEESKNQKA